MDKSQNFMRSLCRGEILEEILFPFPKMKAEEADTLKTLNDSFAQWLKGKDADFRKWDAAGEMPKEFIEEMKAFGLFSLIVPEEYGGMGFSSSAYSRALQELSRYDGSIALTAGAHSSIGMRGLILFGTEEQKKQYLPKLATGELIAAFCLTEAGSGSDAASIKTRADKTEDGWILNGEKLWITNGGIADFFTVFAKTETPEGKMTAFIVTRDMAGVTNGPHEDKMGIRASSTTTVNFENVKLTRAHELGEVGRGFKVAMRILNSGRTGLGGGCVGGMKKMIAAASQHANQRSQFGQPIANFGLIKQKIGHMVVDCYATESVVSMVAGLIDADFEDYAVEAAISKVFASEALWRTTDEALQVAGGTGYMRELPFEKLLRDSRINRIFEGTNEILRLFIALTAVQDVGAQLKEVSQSLGNAFLDPIKGFGVLSEYTRRRVTQATGIGANAMSKHHPSLKAQAEIFDECTLNLSAMCDRLLRKHGKGIVGKQFATRRLGDIMIDLFVLGCVISRVSAAIKDKGEEKAAKEKEILQVFAGQVQRRVRSNFNKIDTNDDELIISLADQALANESYNWDTI